MVSIVFYIKGLTMWILCHVLQMEKLKGDHQTDRETNLEKISALKQKLHETESKV